MRHTSVQVTEPSTTLGLRRAEPSDATRTIPDRGDASPSSSPSAVAPLGSERYRVQFTASATLRGKLERLKTLLRREIPDGDLGALIEKAVTDEIEQIERRRDALTTRPRTQLAQTNTLPRSRYIPAAVRRAVRERDGNSCGYVSASGRRCAEDTALEYHHRHPFGMGGNHDPTNLGLPCRTHNGWLGELDYGRRTGEQRDLPGAA
jgi:hypothetical protein